MTYSEVWGAIDSFAYSHKMSCFCVSKGLLVSSHNKGLFDILNS